VALYLEVFDCVLWRKMTVDFNAKAANNQTVLAYKYWLSLLLLFAKFEKLIGIDC